MSGRVATGTEGMSGGNEAVKRETPSGESRDRFQEMKGDDSNNQNAEEGSNTSKTEQQPRRHNEGETGRRKTSSAEMEK